MKLMYFYTEDKMGIFDGNSIELNFTDEYNFIINKSDNELTIEISKSQNNSLYFSNNLEINLFVGKNGSGKSTLLKKIYNIFLGNNVEDEYICIYEIKENELKYKTNINNLGFQSNDINLEKIEQELTSGNQFFYFDSELAFSEQRTKHFLSLSEKNIKKLLKDNFSADDVNEFDIFLYKPEKIILNLLSKDELFEIIKKEIISNLSLNSLYNNRTLENDITLFNDEFYILMEEIESISEDSIDFYLAILKYYDIESNEEMIYLIKEVLNGTNEFIIDKDIVKNKDKSIMKINILSLLKILKFNFIDKKERNYTDLSYGEKSIFGIFLNLVESLRQTRHNETCYIFLDEPDVSLHPEWQRGLILSLAKCFEKYSKNSNLHLFISTHSPFILSDMFKKSAFYLNKSEKGLIEISKKRENTFANNLNDLLTSNFFLDETMGKYSIRELQKIIDIDINHKNLSRIDLAHFENLKDEIGDMYLQSIINNHITSIKSRMK